MNIFSEIYGTYFRIVAMLLENEVTDEKTVRETVQREGFRDSGLPMRQIPKGRPDRRGVSAQYPAAPGKQLHMGVQLHVEMNGDQLQSASLVVADAVQSRNEYP